MRFLYTSLFYLALPFVLLRLYWRGFKAPDYRIRWQERLGFYPQPSQRNVVWFHAVSVGEAEALFPLIKKIQALYPKLNILITTTTPTGSARVKSVMGNDVEHVYLPYDIPFAVQRFLKHFEPKIVIIVETEIWLNLFLLTKKANISLFIINARLSEKSCLGYQKIPTLIQSALSCVSIIATQSKDDTQRFKRIGAKEQQLKTLGNIKFDLEIDENIIAEGLNLRDDLFFERFVWIIASTHKGEEDIFLQIYPQLKQQIPELLLLIVPRHPERFDEVSKLINEKNLNLVRRSKKQLCNSSTDVYLADTMGELKMLYASSDVAFVGGSLVNIGGHNILEPIALGIPVMFGSFMKNFQEIVTGVKSCQAAIQCDNIEQIQQHLIQLYQQADYRKQLTLNGKQFINDNQGTIDKLIKILHLEKQ